MSDPRDPRQPRPPPPPVQPQTILQAGGAVATGIVDSLKAQPILLVIVLLNIIMVAGAAYFLVHIAQDIHEERMSILDKCIPGKGLDMISFLITLIIIGLLVGLLWWVCDYLPVPEPLNKILKFASMIVAVIIIVIMLAGLAGYDMGFPKETTMTLVALDIAKIRGKRNLLLTMNGESWDVGIKEAQFQGVSGVMRTNKNGQVIENLNFWDGALEVAHNDVVVRNCYFRNKQYHTLYQLSGASDCLVDMCTFDGRPDGAVVNASNADFQFAHNRPMHVDRSIFLDASNDSLNFVGGTCSRSIIIGGGFTAGAHADAISVHTTVGPFTASKLYIDYRQRPGAVIPNACIKYVSVPSIGQGQNAGNGIAHDVMCYDSVCIGGGYTMYLDNHSKIERNIVDWSYWYPSSDQGDVFPPVVGGYKNNKNCKDVGEDYVTIAVSGGQPEPGPEPEPEPNPDDVQAQIDHLTEGLAATNESLKATNDRLNELVENLHKA